MPRNQSEKGPRVVKDKYAIPRTWSREAHIRLLRLPDGSYDVTTCGSLYDNTKIGHKAVATLGEAQDIYHAMSDGFSFNNVPGPRWVNTQDGPK